MKQNLFFEKIINNLELHPKTWLVSGAAGFIGSNLVEFLLKHNQNVVGMDNFATGYQANIDDVKKKTSPDHWKNFLFYEGDIREIKDCDIAFNSINNFCDSRNVKGIDFVLHQAAIGSVPRSIEDPIFTNSNNISGFLNILVSAKNAKVQKFVYATSSSVYGDEETLPKVENKIGNLLSPYALTKLANELYAEVFSLNYDIDTVGLRYFNVFGPRQDPEGSYAAVIPKWINQFIKNTTVEIYGDGETTRDFCFIENVIQANILAAVSSKEMSQPSIFNIAVGSQISLMDLALLIKKNLISQNIASNFHISNGEFRKGDIRHSLADISLAGEFLGYQPTHKVGDGLKKSMQWYLESQA
jgi:UDP-N-acetylglucosamine 4-epimerase|tara:strand:+ start:2312 stop:3382 length:1071 start_codon:yes stop_codon:yes gene_type:complete